MIGQTPNTPETASWSSQELRFGVHIVSLLAELRAPDGETPLTPEQREQYEQVIAPDPSENQEDPLTDDTSDEARGRLVSLFGSLAEAAGLPDEDPQRAKDLQSIRILAGIAIRTELDSAHSTRSLIKALVDAVPALNRTRTLIDELQHALPQSVGRRMAAMLAEQGISHEEASKILRKRGGPSHSTLIRFLAGQTHGPSTTVLEPLMKKVLKLPVKERNAVLKDYEVEQKEKRANMVRPRSTGKKDAEPKQ